MAKEPEKKIELERIYTIPLREKCRVVPRYKKTNKAVKTIKEFLARHMKVYDRDLDKIKIDKYLNEFLWERGIRYPPHKVKVKAVKMNGIVNVELAEPPKMLQQKKIREEKITSRASTGKKKVVEKKEEAPKDSEEEKNKKDEVEKKSALVEAGNAMEKAAAKHTKHEFDVNSKAPKHAIRNALKK